MIPKKCISIDAEQIQAAIPDCRFSSAASWQKYSTMGAGTASFMLFELSTLSQLTAQIRFAAEQGWTLIPVGGGTNLIGSDETLPDTCFIKLTGKSEFSLLEQDSDDPSIFISGPANSLAAITAKALKHGYGGMAALSGIPGTLGGAFKMNAGAMGKCLSDFVVDFTTVDLRTGECFIQNKNDLVWEYRHSGLSDTRILVQQRLRLQAVDPDTEKMAIETERSRRSKAPKGRSSGSIFRNPSLENPAGKILDQLAAKNLSAGSFSVSSEHANWIVNHGSGPAPNREQDIVLLIRQLMDMAQEKAGIQLHPEVKFMNPETQSKIKKYL